MPAVDKGRKKARRVKPGQVVGDSPNSRQGERTASLKAEKKAVRVAGDPVSDRARAKPAVDKVVKTERIAYLRKTRKGVGPDLHGVVHAIEHPQATVIHAVEQAIPEKYKAPVRKELEGRGQLAKVLKKAGDAVAQGTSVASTGAGPTIGLRGTAKALGKSTKGSGFAAVTARQVALRDSGAIGKLLGAGVKDAFSFPGTLIPSVYVPAAASVEASRGDTRRWKKLKKDVAENDPVYNAGAALVNEAKGDTKAARSHLRKLGKAASEHPGLTALEFAGVKGTGGRTAGTVMRVIPSKTTRRIASTERADRTLPGTDLRQPQAYSKDVLKKQRQKAVDRVQARRAENLREKAQDTADVEERARLIAKANRADPTRMSHHQVARRMDKTVDANESIRRIERTRETVKARNVVKGRTPLKGGPVARVKIVKANRGTKLGAGEHALSLVAQNITHASHDDLRAYRDSIAEHYDSLDPAGKQANRALRHEIKKVLASPDTDLGRVARAAEQYEAITKPLQDELIAAKMIAPARADRAALIPYAVRRMGAKHVPEHWLDGEGKVVPASEVNRVRATDPTAARALYTKVPAALRKADGSPLSTSQIRSHMKANEVPEPSFVSQVPNIRGGGSFNIRPERAQAISSKLRTGEGTRKGTFDVHPDTLVANVAKMQGLVSANRGFRRMVGEFTARHDGKAVNVATKTQADAIAANLYAETGEKFRPIRLNPFGAHNEQLMSLLEDVNAHSQEILRSPENKSPVAQALEEALQGKGEGPWGLIPETAAKRLQAHLNMMGAGSPSKVAAIINNTFRKTVLTTSTKWALGNVAEATGRSAVMRAGPKSYMGMKRVIKAQERLDPDAALQTVVRSVGSGHYSAADRLAIHNSSAQFVDTALEGVAQGLGKFWRAPGPKQFAGAWHAWTNSVMHGMTKVESQFRIAMAGKALRDSHLMSGFERFTPEVVERIAKGLDVNEAAALGDAVDRAYGRYGKLSPNGQKLVAYYTPFIAWTLNAVDFMYRVLPQDHPTLTALATSAEQATEEWRKDNKLDLFMKGRLPAFLQGTIPMSHGRHTNFPNRFLPTGAFSDLPGTLGGNLLPQYSPIFLGLKGLDWKGDKLKNADGESLDPVQTFTAAGKSFLDSTVPVLSLGQRIAKKGTRALNPVAPIEPSAKKTAGRKRKAVKVAGWSDQGGASPGQWSDQAGSAAGTWSN